MDRVEKRRVASAAHKRAQRARLKARDIVPIDLNIPREFVELLDGVKKAHGFKSRDPAFMVIAEHYRAHHPAQEGPTTTDED